MIRAEIPQDVTSYKEEFFFGLTLRKLLAVIAVLAIIVPLYIFGSDYIDMSILIYMAIPPCVPIVLIGFKEVDGMPFEKYAKLIWDFYAKEQRRKIVYVPSEKKLQNEFRKVLRTGEEMLRKEELRNIKKQNKKNSKGSVKNAKHLNNSQK